ncbi:MAG: hypothetical protein RBS37_03680 [Bacteroidales bacterium]|jgi:hypothetical protein|nr:hypothetical protein [Bacteroidales bacterium]
MTAPFIVTKSPKSIGIAILLALLFGPIGLFYASVSGGLIMTITPIFLVIVFIYGLGMESAALVEWSIILILFFLSTYWLINIIWAVISVNIYNKKIEDDAKRQYEIWNSLHGRDQNIYVQNIYHKTPEINKSGQQALPSDRPSLQEWLRKNPGSTINDYFTRYGT